MIFVKAGKAGCNLRGDPSLRIVTNILLHWCHRLIAIDSPADWGGCSSYNFVFPPAHLDIIIQGTSIFMNINYLSGWLAFALTIAG